MSELPSAGAAECDVLVVGAGAAGMTAAAVAATEGAQVRLIEASPLVGGTTAWSGGMVWIPGNRKRAGVARADDLDAARRYLAAVAPRGDGALINTFLDRGDEAIAYLEARTPLRLRPVDAYPDYYPDVPGATTGGRVLEPLPFDGARLGPDFRRLRPPLPEFTLLGGMMISRRDIPHFRQFGRSAASTLAAVRLVARYGLERLRARRGTTLHLGNALAGSLFLACRAAGVTIETSARLAGLDRGAAGLVATIGDGAGGVRRIAVARAVVLATGGFPHDAALCTERLPAGGSRLSAAVPDCTGGGIACGRGLGGRLAEGNETPAFWVPVSRFTRRDGSAGLFPHTVTDRAKPGMIAVNPAGRRFVNEAVSYHEFVLAMLREGLSDHLPGYLVCDHRFLRAYGLGRIRPVPAWMQAQTIRASALTGRTPAELEAAAGLPAGALVATLRAYNAAAARGLDPEFGRGTDAYQRHLGDPAREPNPCVAPIDTGPFHAIAIYPATLGTATGLVTDAEARVLDRDGRPVAGLFACGNDMNSVLGGSYPGPGITLGPALTFGYLAGRAAAGTGTTGKDGSP